MDKGHRHNDFAKRWFEDFEAGETFEYGGVEVTAQQILEFGHKFDPEPYHTDPAAAESSIFGGLIASGLHTASLWRRMNVERFCDVPNEGSPGWDEAKWLAPVRPGDVLSVHTECLETRPLNSRPNLGMVRFRHTILDAPGEAKMVIVGKIFYHRKPA